jgi:hypothetical protein
MTYFTNILYIFDTSIIDKNGSFKSGLTVTYKIYKSIDNSLISSGTLVEVGSSGIYQFSYLFTVLGQYRLEYYTPTKYENGIEMIEIQDNQLARILGLSQENYRIFNPVYVKKNGQQCMTTATIKTYSTALDCTNDTNKIAEYQITATFDTEARMSHYKVVKV